MELSSWIATRPVFIFFVLVIGVLLLPAFLLPWWYHLEKHMQESVGSSLQNFHHVLLSEINMVAESVLPNKSSLLNLARVLNSSLYGSNDSSSFLGMEIKVAPILYEALQIIPHTSLVSYIGLGGQYFSYYTKSNITFAVYSNSSKTSKLYKQPVDPNTGKCYGEAMEQEPFIPHITRLTNGSHGYAASIESICNSTNETLLFNSYGLSGGLGVISLGFSVQHVVRALEGIDLHGGSLYLVMEDGHVLISSFLHGEFSCRANNHPGKSLSLEISGKKLVVYCSSCRIAGVPLAYALAFPSGGLASSIHSRSKTTLILLLMMIVVVFLSVLSFVLLMVRAATIEMDLCATLIKQMEATQQAERKSMSKSITFAEASHDIRTALIGIDGLIKISHAQVCPSSELGTILKQIDHCAKDLVGILNSILDTSKMEAGKMQLEEEEFDLAQLIEDVVDLYHPTGMNNGVDVMWDPHDGSVLKYCIVRGDGRKLKQILCNLLSNGIKFTSDGGHVCVRAWAQKPSLENKIIASNWNGAWKYCSFLFDNNKEEYGQLEAMNAAKQNTSYIEFVFEVEDTGRGIPKEKRKLVFENYVQVKEAPSSGGHGGMGTGLGLGIVQSLVRLMGGEIIVVDRRDGEKGSCFRFNIFLSLATTARLLSPSIHNQECEIENQGGCPIIVTTPSRGVINIQTQSQSPRFHILNRPSPKHEGCHIVVLLIKSEQRGKFSQKFMETLGLKVTRVKRWEHLRSTLMKFKQKQPNVSPQCYSSQSEFGSKSDNSSTRSKDMMSFIGGMEPKSPCCKNGKTGRGLPTSFILLVIDASVAPFYQLHQIVGEFRRGLNDVSCKVVWLDKQTSHSVNLANLDDDEILMAKPFHGSRLHEVINLLPGFSHPLLPNKLKKESAFHLGKVSASPCSPIPPLQQFEKQVEGTSKSKPKIKNSNRDDKPLNGKNVLVAEDNLVLQMVTNHILQRLGANIRLCQNGQEAFNLVRSALQVPQNHGGSKNVLPYDFILMDCEMPTMNGYEATRLIRNEERGYGLHIPIIAVTAHSSSDEHEKMIEAGMDFRLDKKLTTEDLLQAIRFVENKECSIK